MAISTYEISVPKRLFKAKVDKDLEFDTNLADYCPDIARLIRVDCTPFIEDCRMENGKAVASGRAVYDLLYETDYKSKLKYCSFTQEFQHSVAVPQAASGNANCFCSAKCEKISCKLLSPRRMVIKATLGTDFDIEAETVAKAVAVNEDGDTFFRKRVIGFQGRAEEVCESFKASESLALAQNEKSIGQVVCGSISLQEPQVTLNSGSAELKTVATLHALCEDEDDEGKYFSVIKSFPVSATVRSNAINEQRQISATVMPADGEFKAELDQYGESRVIKTDFNIKVCLKIREPKAYTVATDLFEREYDGVCVKGSISLPQADADLKASFSAEEKLSDILPKPTAILETSVRESGCGIRAAEGGTELFGSFIISMLAQTEEGIYSFDKSIPYQQFIQQDFVGADVQCRVYPIEAITTLHSDGSITARVIASADMTAVSQQEEEFIADVTKRVAAEARTEPYNLIYRFPQRGESLWDIAKEYRADPARIAESNPESFYENGELTENSQPILIKT